METPSTLYTQGHVTRLHHSITQCVRLDNDRSAAMEQPIHMDAFADEVIDSLDEDVLSDLLRVRLSNLAVDLIYDDDDGDKCQTNDISTSGWGGLEELDDVTDHNISSSGSEDLEELDEMDDSDDAIELFKANSGDSEADSGASDMDDVYPYEDLELDARGCKLTTVDEALENASALALVQAQINGVASSSTSISCVVVDGTYSMDTYDDYHVQLMEC